MGEVYGVTSGLTLGRIYGKRPVTIAVDEQEDSNLLQAPLKAANVNRMQMFDKRVVSIKDVKLEELLKVNRSQLGFIKPKEEKRLIASSHPDKLKLTSKQIAAFGCATPDEYFNMVKSAIEVARSPDLLNQYMSLNCSVVYPNEGDLQQSDNPIKLICETLNEMRYFSEKFPKDFDILYMDSSCQEAKNILSCYKSWANVVLNKRYFSNEMRLVDEDASREDRRYYQRENARIEKQMLIQDTENFLWFLRIAQQYDPRLIQASQNENKPVEVLDVDAEDMIYMEKLMLVFNTSQQREALYYIYRKASVKQRKAWRSLPHVSLQLQMKMKLLKL